MKFPRLTTPRTAANNGGAAVGAPHRDSTRTAPTATATTNTTTLFPRAAPSDAALRRCHSARPHLSSTRAHSQKTPRGGGSRELPIPPPMMSSYSDGGDYRSSPPQRGHAEESDLARMYDCATWNMYERIVSARRRRLALIELQARREEEQKRVCDAVADSHVPSAATDDAAKSDAVDVHAAERDERRGRQRSTLQTPLHKNSSNDDNSTLATADETDKASTTSSWSRADSPLVPEQQQRRRGETHAATAVSPGLPSLRRLGFSSSLKNDEGRRESSTNCNNEDDAFIFELDM
ncbi:hypothetical protein ACHAXA_004625 [Cyclostephanos tholiformis]|uniref:Uncharacterized protein n=1 Tax=Cyclostephanos tholiformis TaxID=382380 RepID=A0ABD3SNY9_9STRA